MNHFTDQHNQWKWKDELVNAEELILHLIHNVAYKTVNILHDEPQVWRIWWEVENTRIALHKIFPCVNPDDCFFHPHPWPSAIRCLKWWYVHYVWSYNWDPQVLNTLSSQELEDFSKGIIRTETSVSSGDYYLMNDIRQFHQVSANSESFSIMVMGNPYFPWATKQFSRKTTRK